MNACPSRAAAILLLLLVCWPAATVPLPAGESQESPGHVTSPCGGAPVVVVSLRQNEAVAACAAASAAISFLAASGVRSRGVVLIRLVASAQKGVPERAVGCYDLGKNEVRVLNETACAKRFRKKKLFGERFSSELFRGFIAHEVAHALLAGQGKPVSRLIHEYVAYVVQMSMLTPTTRMRILQRYRHISAGDRFSLNLTGLMMSPEIFAVRAYKNFVRMNNRAECLGRIVRGEVMLGVADAC